MPELPEEPSKLDIATMIANNWAKTGANVALSPFHMIKELMDHGYKPGTQDVQGVNNAAGVGLALMGAGGAIPRSAASELGAFKSGILSGNKSASKWTEELDSFLRGAMTRNTGHGSRKAIMREFHAEHPNSGITDSAISSRISKLQNWGAPNRDIPIGSDVPNAAIDFLKSSQPVDKTWIENWAKDAGVHIDPDTRHGTTYFNMKSNISDKPVVVRLPEDAHWGRPLRGGEIGRRFDTGYDIGKWENKAPPDLTNRYAPGLINQAGGSYASPKNLEPALELATGASRGGEFKLVSPDYAHISRPKGEAFHEQKSVADPNQLKLFSNQTDPTTSAIIAALTAKRQLGPKEFNNIKSNVSGFPSHLNDPNPPLSWGETPNNPPSAYNMAFQNYDSVHNSRSLPGRVAFPDKELIPANTHNKSIQQIIDELLGK